MKTLTQPICIVLSLFLLWQCDSDVTGKLQSDYAGDRLTLSGFFSVDTISLTVGKSTDAFSPIERGELLAKNPQVYIEDEGGTFQFKLTLSDSAHFYAGKIGLIAGKKYRIVASADNLDAVESNFMQIPDLLSIQNLTFKNLPISGRITNELSFDIQDSPNPDHYFFDIAIKKANLLQTAPFWVPEDGILDNCYAVFVFTDLCFNGKRTNLTYRVSPDGFFKGFKGPQVADSIVIRFGGISEEAYRSQLAMPVDDGFIEGINEPPLTYSNIKNGYGVVFAHSLKDYTIPVSK